MSESTSVSLLPQTELQAVIVLDNTVKACRQQMVEADASGNQMLKALVLARATVTIRKQLLPMMDDIMQLMGTPLGFRTDRDRGDKPYQKEVVCDVVIVALLRGFQVVGNEINIIAGNFYGTKEGFARLLREYPGFTDWKTTIGVAQTVGDSGALIPVWSKWKFNGTPDEMICDVTRNDKGQAISDTRIAVRVNSGMGMDAIIGKAESKLYRRIYQRLTGSEVSSVEDAEDGDMGDVIVGTATPTAPATAGIGQDQKQTTTTTATSETQTAPDTGAQFKALMDPTKTDSEAQHVYDSWYGPDSSRESDPGDHERDRAYYQAHVAKIHKSRDEHAAANPPVQPGTKKTGSGKQKQGTLV